MIGTRLTAEQDGCRVTLVRSQLFGCHTCCVRASCAHLHDKRACVETRCNAGRVWRCHGSSPWDGYGYDVVRGGLGAQQGSQRQRQPPHRCDNVRSTETARRIHVTTRSCVTELQADVAKRTALVELGTCMVQGDECSCRECWDRQLDLQQWFHATSRTIELEACEPSREIGSSGNILLGECKT